MTLKEMTMSNSEIVSVIYEAFAGKGMERVLELVDPDCVITQDDALPWGGRFVGIEGAATFATGLGTTIQSTLVTTAFYETGDRVVQCGRTQGTVIATGVTFDVPEVHIWTLRDNKVVAAEFYIETARMLEALGSPS
jgi:uncharacterized protein